MPEASPTQQAPDNRPTPKIPTQHYEVLKELADCHAALGRLAQARDCYLQAAAIEPKLPGHQIGLAALALLESRLSDAQQIFAAVAESDPTCAEAVWGLAMVHQARQDHPAAKAAYLKFLQMTGGGNPQALLALFHTSRLLNDFAGVEAILQSFLDKHPGNPDILLCQAELQAAQGHLEPARQSLLTLLALSPGHPQAQTLLTRIEAKS